ncbi:MAG: DUF1611 domain-containing protein [Chloroflexota bacterium]|nr:DUF1611 domain-containing protein [Chloroflexota bacterium]
MQPADYPYLKHSFATHRVPLSSMSGIAPFERAPRVGDLVAAEVLSIGRHTAIEGRDGVSTALFPGDRIVGVFGNRYATDQYEGYVPAGVVEECDVLSVGGVCGLVISRHESILKEPTRLRVLGAVCDRGGYPLNQRDFGMRAACDAGGGEVILVVGTSMNSGKTTLAGTLVNMLTRAGHGVAAAKVTGTAAGKDARFFASAGARPALDFTHVGYPSTFMLEIDELLAIHRTLLAHLRAGEPDYVVLEVADGLLQRETGMLLASGTFRDSIDHVFYAGGDALAIESGVRHLRARDLPVRATGGVISQSALASLEAERATGLPCLTGERLLAGEAVRILGANRKPRRPALGAEIARRDPARAVAVAQGS